MDREAFAGWLDAYKAAWEQAATDKVLSLFTPDAVYEETPFDEPMRGHQAIRRYWEEGAEQAQRNVRFSYDIYSVEGDVGMCHWHSTFERVPSGERVELDGVLRCTFAADGKCRRFQEWWHRRTL